MRYIVGYTDTPSGEDALNLAVRLARSMKRSLDIVIVLRSEARATLVPVDAGYEKYLHQAAEEWLHHALTLVPRDMEVNGHIVYAESFAQGLLDASRDLEARMIVVGAARGGLLGRFTVGSVANALLHSAVVPVALAPEGSIAEVGMEGISRVTCAVGTRSGAKELVDAGILAARAAGVSLRLVSLVALDAEGVDTPPEVQARAEEHAAETLAYAAEHLPDDIEVTVLTASGNRVEDAVAALDWDPGEVVFVGSSRLAQPRQIFLGTTAAKMLRELPVPMIVVPRDSILTVED
ncbi:nucleotide-binding universal stress UspA family protein [Okibacterium sp. HSC-33S16]|uniref:universal stress protein n=1 Tax=Okibacterium sp. HSC-33S16 TaxID=2910965 RepID=UPI00209D6197|nr:universal stress protein [Okibacterium sp. HSC-33S16]MCP2032381.1 nucleotide-binding universal stress UspA family protein [Okibacterium sp. HSC-33S16]